MRTEREIADLAKQLGITTDKFKQELDAARNHESNPCPNCKNELASVFPEAYCNICNWSDSL